MSDGGKLGKSWTCSILSRRHDKKLPYGSCIGKEGTGLATPINPLGCGHGNRSVQKTVVSQVLFLFLFLFYFYLSLHTLQNRRFLSSGAANNKYTL